VPITPDTKDWTWVLDRPCPQCGFDASGYDPSSVSAALRENAAAWAAVLARPDVRVRPSEDRWSPLEYACHVRDVFRLFERRLALMLEEDDPVFANWDQDETALADRYDLQDPVAVGKGLASAAATYAARLDTVRGDQWDRPGTRSNGSRFSVATLALYALHDPIHHLWDVTTGP
jgi:hypothetical protein